MEDIILSIVLFIVYLCTISCLIYSPSNFEKSQKVATKTQSLPIEKAFAQMLDELENSDQLSATAEYPLSEISKDEEKQVESAIEPLIESQKEKPKTGEGTEIDLSKLPLRQARKVAKALNIRQRVNGKDAPVKWLRLQILQRVQEEPSAIAKIHEVLGVDDRVSA